MKTLSRRSVTTGLAAAVTAIPAVGLSNGLTMAKGEAGELTLLIQRYWRERDAFNQHKLETDEEADALAAATYEAAERALVGVPARSAEDAHAAIDWLIREGTHSMIELGDDGSWGSVCKSLATAVRDYLASQV
jgi:hypothetical protein